MSAWAWVWGGLAAVAAVVDWGAVAKQQRAVELVAKPLATIGLIGVAVALVPADPSRRAWFVAALVLSLLGDVALLDRVRGLLPGLAVFLLAHIAYVVGFLQGTGAGTALAAYAVAAAFVTVLVGQRIVRALLAAPGRQALVGPVVLYMSAITVMVAAAFAAGPAIAALGAVAFYASDGLIGEERFVRSRAWQPVAIMVTYHLGQAGLVAGLL